MTSTALRIVTRESPLALWQASFVKDSLIALHSGIEIEILGITTQADKLLDSSLESLGGKGAFVKELEQALLDEKADIAVHSMKDVTINLPDGLSVPVVMKREDPRDVMVANSYQTFDELPVGARVGTSSLRRRCQLMAIRPDLQILDIRGNVGTRLRKLDDGEYDALILAAAGVIRLGMQERVSEYFDTSVLLPAVSQAALGIEMCTDNQDVLELISPLTHAPTQKCVDAERALNRELGGDCHVPIAGFAQMQAEKMEMHALVGRVDGSEIIKVDGESTAIDPMDLGKELGQKLLELGAASILQNI
ncbi:MAG: hydroxymethylbilane synthase [Gammaproteobacteria bacterium]|nr:hydroxymethylbilane synthase [Gammaproteobacteria bacterium]